MGVGRNLLIKLAVVLVYFASLALMASAAEDGEASAGVPVPEIAQGRGENCVEDTGFMRRNHMDMLMHQRDDTVVQGIRTQQYSLKECVDCHAVAGPDERAVTASSPEHFCRSCHDYAAVTIDCFQCHASRPDADAGHHENIAARTSRQ